MARLELHRLGKRFPDGTEALRELSLTLADGELLVLLGPSGCGKSTLLRLVAGLETPSAGEIRLDGERLDELPPERRDVAMVFQSYALYPHLDVRRNLEFPLRVAGFDRGARAARVERVAALLGLGELLDRRPAALSGGQAQRVAMGRALVREPRLLLLDEPLSNLDARLRVELRAELGEVQRRTGITTLYVTHDQVEALTLGDRVAVLRRGVLHQVAPPLELYARPADRFVAGFLGSPPMNLLRAAVERGGDRWRLRLGDAALPIDPPPRAVAAGRATVVGLRPEAFRDPEAAADLPRLELAVELVEQLGHEQVVFLAAPAPAIDSESGTEVPAQQSRIAARLAGSRPMKRGEPIELAVDLSALVWFDDDGRRVRDDDSA